jgi:hypothetical protein
LYGPLLGEAYGIRELMKKYSLAVRHSLLITLILIFFITFYSIKQVNAAADDSLAEPFDISKWKSTPLSKVTLNELMNSSYSSIRTWNVYLQDNHLMNRRIKESNYISISVPDGILYSLIYGEKGGGVYFKSFLNHQYQISGGNFVQFIKNGDTIYTLEGLAHMASLDGKICRIRYRENKWEMDDYIQLWDVPYAATLIGQDLFIVTHSKLLKANLDTKNVQTILDNMLWGKEIQYPNSMVMSDNCLYIGMRGGIARITMDKYEVTWLSPQ